MPKIQNMMFKAQMLSQMARLHDGVDAATAALLGDTALLDAVERAEGAAHQLVALFQQQKRRHGTIDTAAHRHQDFLFLHPQKFPAKLQLKIKPQISRLRIL